jgi:hypothetical protein
MKEELFKMAQECLSEEEVKEILRNKFKESNRIGNRKNV